MSRRCQCAARPAGLAWCAGLGWMWPALRPGRHGLARACLDWTEREHHLAGRLATALLRAFCARGWLRRAETGRAVQVTPKGWIVLRAELGLDPASCGGPLGLP